MFLALCKIFLIKKGLFIVEVHLVYPSSLQALYSNTQKQIIQIQHNRIKKPNWQKATSQLFTSVAEDLNSGQPSTNPASARAGLEPGTAGLRVRRADHSATLPPDKMLDSMLASLGEITGFQTEYWYNFQRPGACFSIVAMTFRFPKAVYVCRVYIFGLKNYTIKLSVNKQN